MPDIDAMLAGAREAMTVSRVFGEPIERGEVTIIPVAQVQGGGGGGGIGGAEDPANSSNVESGAQPAAPGFQASVPPATWPEATIPFSASSEYGQ